MREYFAACALLFVIASAPADAMDFGNGRESTNFIDATSLDALTASLDQMVSEGLMTQEEATRIEAAWLREQLAKQLPPTNNQ